MIGYPTIKEGFAGQGENIVRLLQSLNEADFAKPSRLPGWDILTLAAHTMRAPDVVLTYGLNVTTEPPARNRISYYDFKGADIAEAVTQRAREAAETTTAKTIAADFAQVMAKSTEFLETLKGETVIKVIFGTIAVEEYIPTRILEMVIHSLDLTESLGLAPILHPAAEAVTLEILEALLEGERPAALSDNVAFLEAATGRKPYPGLVIPAFSS
jgi:uncharacterized protein (TIGR03083 family)